MPVTPTYPGVYIEEIPSGVRTITGVATSITAFVGFTARGPVNRATRILNFGDFERAFGGLHRDSEIGYAVQQFFLNGGTDAYVVRVATGAAAASIGLRYGGGAGDDALTVRAANEGDWGNYVRLAVNNDTANPDSTFNLIVTRFERQGDQLIAAESEQFRNLSMNSRSPAYAPAVINSGSRLVQAARAAGIAFADRGFSMSGDLLNGALNTFTNPTAQETTLSGVLDGSDTFTLTLNNPAAIGDVGALVTALSAAIATAGLSSRLLAERVDELGAADAAGRYVKLTSQNVPANPNTANEFSSVQIVVAPSSDASRKLKLGLAGGGREKESASTRRPLPTGTLSADLTDILGTSVGGALDVTINDNTTGAPVAIASQTGMTLPATAVGPGLATALQNLIRTINHPAAQQATAIYAGNRLQVAPSAATPNASIVFAGAAATAARLTGAGSFVNVQQYNLGTGAAFGAQESAVPGADGTAPVAADLLGAYNTKTGIYALRDVDLFNLLVIPRTSQLSDVEARGILSAALAFCGERRAFCLVDPPPNQTPTTIGAWVSALGASKNAAIFFPRVQIADPLNGFRLADMPPSGTVAGVFARTDSERGVWKAPAGTEAVLRGVQGLAYTLTDPENGTLNPLGINCLRSFAVYGRVVWGARTLEGADQLASEWKYIPVRRIALYIEESLYRGTKWVVFEPNDEPLWAQIRLNVGAFMHNLFRQGAFQGRTPREAYLVKCDKETTTQNDINLGIVNILVGFAPLKPAEFVIIKIQQLAGQVQT